MWKKRLRIDLKENENELQMYAKIKLIATFKLND